MRCSSCRFSLRLKQVWSSYLCWENLRGQRIASKNSKDCLTLISAHWKFCVTKVNSERWSWGWWRKRERQGVMTVHVWQWQILRVNNRSGERRLQKSESQHLPTIIVIELGVGSLAEHVRGCLRGTGAHWCYSKEKKNQSICSWSSLAKSKPGFEFPTSLPVFHLSVVYGSRPLCDLSVSWVWICPAWMLSLTLSWQRALLTFIGQHREHHKGKEWGLLYRTL